MCTWGCFTVKLLSPHGHGCLWLWTLEMGHCLKKFCWYHKNPVDVTLSTVAIKKQLNKHSWDQIHCSVYLLFKYPCLFFLFLYSSTAPCHRPLSFFCRMLIFHSDTSVERADGWPTHLDCKDELPALPNHSSHFMKAPSNTMFSLVCLLLYCQHSKAFRVLKVIRQYIWRFTKISATVSCFIQTRKIQAGTHVYIYQIQWVSKKEFCI